MKQIALLFSLCLLIIIPTQTAFASVGSIEQSSIEVSLQTKKVKKKRSLKQIIKKIKKKAQQNLSKKVWFFVSIGLYLVGMGIIGASVIGALGMVSGLTAGTICVLAACVALIIWWIKK